MKLCFHLESMAEVRYLGLTLVSYREGDFLGYLMAWASLIPLALLIFEASGIVLAETATRLRDSVFILSGQLFNELLNLALKHVFRTPRPIST